LNETLQGAVVVAVNGPNNAVTPFGNPVVAKPTLPLKPSIPLTLMVLLPLLASGIVRLVAEVARLKAGATTVKLIVAVLVRDPEVPLIVSG
jgi:hypothetical protein